MRLRRSPVLRPELSSIANERKSLFMRVKCDNAIVTVSDVANAKKRFLSPFDKKFVLIFKVRFQTVSSEGR